MEKTAIICEYNPMHFGHIYQIEKINKEYIIGFMSGSFVQRGEPAIIDKFTRARLAIENGCDLILEMPQVISLQSSKEFSYGSISILNKIDIDNLSFGIEGDIDTLNKIANLENVEEDLFNEKIQSYINEGLSYKKSYINTLKYFGFNENDISANNTLAIQYIKDINKINKEINIIPIKRKDSKHEDKDIINSIYQSSTNIRKLRLNNNFEYKNYVNENVYKELKKEVFTIDSYFDIFKYLLTIEKVNISENPHYENGMENLLMNSFKNAKNLKEAIDLTVNKRYSESRIKRLLICMLLDIKKDDIENIDKISYIKPLAFNEKGREILSSIDENIQIINKPNKAHLDKINQRFLDIDIKATFLYNMFSNNLNNDYINNPFI